MAPPINRLGQVFGRLTVIAAAGIKLGHSQWLCQCTCGQQIVTANGRLQSGKTQSCGCLRMENLKARTITHGATVGGKHAYAPEYSVWCGMRDRCTNPNNNAFSFYGGRGITLCDRWLSGEGGKTAFECFREDMGPRPSKGHSIDRIDVNGPYSPENCRWATRQQQMANQRKTVFVTYAGERMCLAEAARRCGVEPETIRFRMLNGWPESEWFRPVVPGWSTKKNPAALPRVRRRATRNEAPRTPTG